MAQDEGAAAAAARPVPEPIPVNPEAMQRWREARFGMFIHWGPVSQTGQEVSWSRGRSVPQDKYDELYKTFNPEKFNADEWVTLAKNTGMKYIILTTKHHDGFCLWDTNETDYDIMATPFKRDIVKELAEACKRQDIKFGVYYSVVDWYHPDFPDYGPRGRSTREAYDLDRYEKYMNAQIRELLTGYGEIFCLWFDQARRGGAYEAFRGQNSVNEARRLQPNIIVNNRASSNGVPGDFLTPEQRVGAFERNKAWESCMTVSAHNHWAWGGDNDRVKPFEQVLGFLVRCAGGDGNMLLNVGPRPTGEIDAEQVAILEKIGAWMKVYGESIYGTRGGPFMPGTWGSSTCKDNTIYVHIPSFEDGIGITLPPINRKILSGKLVGGDTEIQVEQTDQGIRIQVPQEGQSEPYTVVKLEVDGPAFDITPVKVPEPKPAAEEAKAE